ncbi:P-loop containing nucleoside triphosphate hydrolase protein [Parathielavia hyrcaniae]|uniref:P-loop containing nucleoside triphosphate hydrolase protein n=1 Tax=Parathielavia hyrcaniae TaxID=113614 RepID=A0AAN6Q2I5_9PEZI|nr:P-loop containing nucleoside triphosphate hydrolase protein [Parathielavia hyrcaniae]
MGPERKPPAGLTTPGVQANLFEAAEGSHCATQTLYEGSKKCQCCKNWVVDYPEDLRVAVDDQLEAKQKALVVRMAKNHRSDGGKPLVLHSVVVQSSSLRNTLNELFHGVRGITPSLKKLVFRAPFQPFFYRWDRLTEILERQKTEDPDAAAYTQLLYDVLDAEIRDCRAEVADLLHNGVITYPLLWALFEPGVIVFEEPGRFYLVENREYDQEKMGYLWLSMKYVDWNGHRFGYGSRSIHIQAFSGTQDITSLPVYPAKFHPSYEEAKASAIARGRKFQELAGIHYMAYLGTFVHRVGRDMNGTMERQASGRIIVDAAGYAASHKQADDEYDSHGGGFLAALSSGVEVPQLHVTDDIHHPVPGHGLPPGHKRHWNRQYETGCPVPGYSHPPILRAVPKAASKSSSTELTELTPDQLLLCIPTVKGYSLKLKLWGLFSVSKIAPIAFNDSAFPNLRLPPTYKDLILSFVETHPSSAPQDTTPASTALVVPDDDGNNNNNRFDDLIEGKGLGVVLLLVGNPGTGKTLTAEAVADQVRRPLYVLSAGELGQDAGDVETRLRDSLELAESWGAVLLLDECDVFLQERSGGGGVWDLARNEIVAVFLRLLEYYRGILFMTTNRADTLDKAFHSRVHLTLRYPDLDEAAKEHIWRHFTTMAGPDGVEFGAELYQSLARLPMNGRQIKNTVKLATLVAARRKVSLGVEHVRTALQAMEGPGGVEFSW